MKEKVITKLSFSELRRPDNYPSSTIRGYRRTCEPAVDLVAG